jgi:hypothetical protein
VNIRRHLTYANVGVTICLFLLIAGGAAYALNLPPRSVGSREIKKHTIRAVNLKKHRAVRGVDVVRNALRGRQIAESTLNASAFAPVAGNAKAVCDLSSASGPIDCVTASIRLKRRSRLLVIAAGGEESAAVPSHASCAIEIDGTTIGVGAAPGEENLKNTSGAAQNGFAITVVTSGDAPPLHAGTVGPGRHVVAMNCQKGVGSPKIDQPQISVLGISAG